MEWGGAPPLPPEPPPPPPADWAGEPAPSLDYAYQHGYWSDPQHDAFGRPLQPAAPRARQALPPDQRALFIQSAGGGAGGSRRGGGSRPAHGGKAARRAVAAAAAAQLAALPATATGDYLDPYPAVKQLMQRFKCARQRARRVLVHVGRRRADAA